MKTLITKTLLTTLILSFSLSLFAAGKLYQVSTIGALTTGVFDGDTPYSEVAKHGDFGLGTFEGLNGEMVALDGKYYRMDPKGKLVKLDMKTISPFAEVTHFKPTMEFAINNVGSYSDLTKEVLQNLKNKNIPYAIKIKGDFNHIDMRSLLKYEKPYPNLVKASQEQPEFSLKQSNGTLVGFWFPDYWGVIAVNGLHMHFVNDALTKGGHVLNMKIKNATVEVMPIYTTEIKLPNTKTFAEKDFNQDLHKQIEEAEGSTT